MTASPESREIVVVTGASTGIGAATARDLARRGLHVLAGVRRDADADAIRGPGIEPVIIDVTKPHHIEALATRVNEDPQRRAMRALVNNAGVGVNVPFEVYTMDEWRKIFEVNLFGHIAVTQALLPALIRNKGRVVNISSVGGKVAMATYGPYAGTKFALEAVSDSLRRELAPLGVQVVVIEPGPVTTDMLGRASEAPHELTSAMTHEQRQRYGGLVHAVAAQAAASAKLGSSAETAAEVIANAVEARRPCTRYTVGRSTAVLTRLTRVLPDRALDLVLAAGLRPYFPKISPSSSPPFPSP